MILLKRDVLVGIFDREVETTGRAWIEFLRVVEDTDLRTANLCELLQSFSFR